MTRFWTHHWQNRYWRNNINPEYVLLGHSAGNGFRKRGISPGDVVYIVSLAGGQLLLGGRMTVKQIVSRDEAVHILGTKDFHDAPEHIIADQRSSTPLNLHRMLAPALSRQLRFVSPRSEPKSLCFASDTHLDVQATRGIHELTPASAALLEQIIEITDRLPRSDGPIIVTEELLHSNGMAGVAEQVRQSKDAPNQSPNPEGLRHRRAVFPGASTRRLIGTTDVARPVCSNASGQIPSQRMRVLPIWRHPSELPTQPPTEVGK